jgi:hypothetical protein
MKDRSLNYQKLELNGTDGSPKQKCCFATLARSAKPCRRLYGLKAKRCLKSRRRSCSPAPDWQAGLTGRSPLKGLKPSQNRVFSLFQQTSRR